jgi:allantoinase
MGSWPAGTPERRWHPTVSDTPRPARDFIGYGQHPPHPQWPGGARLAVQFVLNYEEGGEMSVDEGDPHAETFLSEIVNAAPFPDRHMSMESMYEYGSRSGVWRILRAFERRAIPLTIFAVAEALSRNLDVAAAFGTLGHEIAGHGLRWLSYQGVDEATERAHMAAAVEQLTALTGSPPLGWYTGRDSPRTRMLVMEHGGFLYDSDSYADDLPYWYEWDGRQLLVIPYALDTNDMRFATVAGFNSGTQFFDYLKDAFDVLYTEGADAPKMLSVGLHCRLTGRPGRIAALERFLDYVQQHDAVWITRRVDIARHWHAVHPALPRSV